MTTNYPWDIKDVAPEVEEKIKALYTGHRQSYVRVGPKGYFLNSKFKEEAANFYNMEVRATDVFVITYPRSGTTWTQELVWMVANDLDYATAEAIPLNNRFPFLEFSILPTPDIIERLQNLNVDSEEKLNLNRWMTKRGIDQLDEMTTQRFIKTHLALSLLSPQLLDTAKVVYVARDPRDVVVSLYHFVKSIPAPEYIGDLKSFWKLFTLDLQHWSPFFDHLKEAWENRHHPNMLFIFYEHMSKDLPAAIRQVADFFDKKFSEEQIARLCEHLSFENFKMNISITYESDAMKKVGITESKKITFIRKGKSGGWREYFDDEMAAEAESWIANNLKDTDLRFPQFYALI